MQSFGDDLPNTDTITSAVNKSVEEQHSRLSGEITSAVEKHHERLLKALTERQVGLEGSTRGLVEQTMQDTQENIGVAVDNASDIIRDQICLLTTRLEKRFRRLELTVCLVGLASVMTGLVSVATFLAAKGVW